ncbi:MAG: organomercurial lyase [Gemmatimonadota bacterium]
MRTRASRETAVLSFLSPVAATFDRSAANVMARFCHFVFFLADREAGEAWIARHPGTFLCSLEEGYSLGRRLNARNFGPALARREAAAAGEGR